MRITDPVSVRRSAALQEKLRLAEPSEAAAVGITSAGMPLHYVYAKRCLDLTLALLLIITVAPLLLLISLVIVIDSGWPVIYRQERIGARGRRRGRRIEWEEARFLVIKFRTMVRDADRTPVHEHFIERFVKGELGPRSAQSDGFKLSDDSRVTRVGRFLRGTSLDEFPQLFNVLSGKMSLVGPRPVPPYEVALYEPRHRARLAALPGITGPWQLEGRGRVGFEEMVRIDIDYVRTHSLSHDLSLLARTLPAVLGKKGAR